MKIKFKKIKTEHTILPDFFKLLMDIEKIDGIDRLIPGRISRQQKGSSDFNFKVTTPTPSGLKCIMSKGSTAQELFVICKEGFENQVANDIGDIVKEFEIGKKPRIKNV